MNTLALKRLREAVAAGKIPEDLWPLVAELAQGADSNRAADLASTPAQRLAVRVSTEVDRWMDVRKVNTRTITVSRSTVQRLLKAQSNSRIDSIAEVADALGCEAVVEFVPRPGLALSMVPNGFMLEANTLRPVDGSSTVDADDSHRADAAPRPSRGGRDCR